MRLLLCGLNLTDIGAFVAFCALLMFLEVLYVIRRYFSTNYRFRCYTANGHSYAYRLSVETVAHGLTGALLWFLCFIQLEFDVDITCSHRTWITIESCTWAGFCAVLVDADHFIAAGSLNIQDVRKLSGRPFMHWMGWCLLLYGVFVLLIPVLPTVQNFWILSRCLSFCWLFLVALLSHVLRDSAHRGFWFWPPPDPRTWSSPHQSSVGENRRLSLPIIYCFTAFLILPVFRQYVQRLKWSASSFAPISTLFFQGQQTNIV
ncbi:unnamed protein product [Calicophoron daubneyi]|uniref:Transmembrane protein 267 n=1 Tax=Calicophoron daubneyi TaxID=300641 RepID=A0AAV2U1X7_CALDB